MQLIAIFLLLFVAGTANAVDDLLDTETAQLRQQAAEAYLDSHPAEDCHLIRAEGPIDGRAVEVSHAGATLKAQSLSAELIRVGTCGERGPMLTLLACQWAPAHAECVLD